MRHASHNSIVCPRLRARAFGRFVAQSRKGLKKSGYGAGAHLQVCVSRSIPSLADLKGLRQPNFSQLQRPEQFAGEDCRVRYGSV